MLRRFAILIVLALLVGRFGRADEIALLSTGKQGGQARYEMSVNAKAGDTISLATYEFGRLPESVVLIQLDLLREAAHRGAKVRILIDAFGNRLPNWMMGYLMTDPYTARNIEFREVRPFDISQPFLAAARMHSKLFIRRDGVTGATELITGGRNVSDKYFGYGARRYRDAEIYVKGYAADKSAAYFESIWASGNSRKIRAAGIRLTDAEREKARRMLEEASLGMKKLPFYAGTGVGREWRLNLHSVDGVEFVSKGFGTRRTDSIRKVPAMVASAQREVILAAPYVTLTREMKVAILQARKHGATITLITNSGETNNKFIAHAGFELDVPWLLKNGVQIHILEKRPQNYGYMLHKKVVYVDGEMGFVGSRNLDGMSQYYNSEVGVIVQDPGFAADLKRSLLLDIQASRPVRQLADVVTTPSCFRWFIHLAARLVHDRI